MVSTNLTGKTIAFLVAGDRVEQIELTEPWDAVKAAGGMPKLVSLQKGKGRWFNHRDRGDKFPVDETVHSADAKRFDALVLPGGSDRLRTDPKAVAFAKAFATAGKPVAVICHGPWTLIEADVLRGRTITSWPSMRIDIGDAGGTWVDKKVVVCTAGAGPLVSSRKPDDLTAFCETLVDTFAAA